MDKFAQVMSEAMVTVSNAISVTMSAKEPNPPAQNDVPAEKSLNLIAMLQEQRAIAVEDCDEERKAKRVKKLDDALDRAFDNLAYKNRECRQRSMSTLEIFLCGYQR